MARMYPERVTAEMQSEPSRRGEVQVYRALANTLDDSFAVFYSVPWLGWTADRQRRDGEADFIVVSEELGLLVIEVKGGEEVGRDPRTGRWYSISFGGNRNEIKDPYQQATTSKHNLIALLKERVTESGFVPAAHAVVFPGQLRQRGNLGPGFEDLTAFADDLQDLGAFVRRVMSSGRRGNEVAFSARDRHAIEQYFGRSLRLQTTVAADVTHSELEIIELSERQLDLLSYVRRVRRVEISGGAGTGKTMLAKEVARRLANEGLRVGWICYNRSLRNHVASELASVDGVGVYTFHQLCEVLTTQAGIDVGDSTVPGYFDRLAGSLLDALDRLPDWRFDALVIDEAQDLRAEWCEGLLFCLRDPANDVVYAFRDDNQLFYGQSAPLLGAAPFPLDKNLRNTRPIHALVRQLYRGAIYETGGVSGPQPVFHEVDAAGLPATLALVLRNLIEKEGFRADQIVVLTCRGKEGSHLPVGTTNGGIRLGWLGEARHGDIAVETVRRFKGLESLAVVLCELDALLDDSNAAELGYVGITRARSYLAAVGTAKELDRLRQLGRP